MRVCELTIPCHDNVLFVFSKSCVAQWCVNYIGIEYCVFYIVIVQDISCAIVFWCLFWSLKQLCEYYKIIYCVVYCIILKIDLNNL